MTAESVEELLRRNQEADLLRFTTAGSVDDGKSTLIGRMLHDSKNIYEDQLEAVGRDSAKAGRTEVDLALLTDGLKAEREQGITIDVAYRYFSTPKRRFIIADTPGHEQYTRNMVTGASTANLAIILIDARKGVLTQSKRHGFIASLLGIPHIVVCVNKVDLVDYSQSRYEEIVREYREFAARLEVKDMIFIPVSALKGDNVVERSENMPWYTDTTLLSHLENVYIGGDRNLIDFRFPVQYANRPHLDFRGFCGTIASGIVRPGDEVLALPSRKMSRVKSILGADGEIQQAIPPQSVTITLEDEIDISRGDMLVHPGNLPNLEQDVEAMVVWMHDEPLRKDKPYLIKHGTNTVRGRFTELAYRVNPNDLRQEEAETLGLNEIGRVVLGLFKPIPVDEYARNRQTGSFIIIDVMNNITVGAGMVIERACHRYGHHTRAAAMATPRSEHVVRHGGDVGKEERSRLLGQTPRTLWFTGLSGCGKSTIAFALEKSLVADGRACYVLDGDNIRHGLCRDLGFSSEDRTENIRRVAEVAKLMNDAGLIVITSFISPYTEDRDAAREIIGADAFLEIFVDTPLEVCEARDPKGLYAKARSGEILEFTGITAPYEAPKNAELIINGAITLPDEAVKQIRGFLK